MNMKDHVDGLGDTAQELAHKLLWCTPTNIRKKTKYVMQWDLFERDSSFMGLVNQLDWLLQTSLNRLRDFCESCSFFDIRNHFDEQMDLLFAVTRRHNFRKIHNI